MVEEAVSDSVAELLRLRVRETWELYGHAEWIRKCQLSKVSVTVVNKKQKATFVISYCLTITNASRYTTGKRILCRSQVESCQIPLPASRKLSAALLESRLNQFRVRWLTCCYRDLPYRT